MPESVSRDAEANVELTRGWDGRYNAVVAVEEKNRKIVAAVRKCAPAVLAALWAAPFLHYGSTKRAVPDMTDAVCVAGGEIDGGAGRPALPKGRTSGIPVGRDVPVAPAAAMSASVASDAAATSAGVASGAAALPESTTTTADGRFRVAVRPAANDLVRPGGVELFDRWRRRGAADDAFRLAPPGWWFRLTDGFSDGVTIFSRGEIRPAARTPCFPPVFADRVSLLPQARWHMLGSGADESGLWHCLTPSNTLLIGWTNAALGRDPSAPTNAVAELFRDGRFTYRYADRAVEHSPVLPFDWDGDGLENAVDPDPRVAGPDAHGTNAEWHRVVCSNVFTSADADTGLQTRVGVGDGAGADGALPPGVAWREGVNPDAYYFVDVVAGRGPAPVCFTADRESRLGSPVVVALAEATNRVPLLVGVKYAVTSEVPFSVSVPAANARECVRVSWTSGLSCEIAWPLGFTFTECVSGSSRTYAVGVVPYDPGGAFDWGGATVQGGGAAVRLRASAASCGCASGEGRTLSFSCTAECPCGGGCAVAGAYALEGASFAVAGGVCRCGFDDSTPWRGDSCSCGGVGGLGCPCVVCICHGVDAGPGLSVSFGRDAVVFEEAYVDAPGVWRPRRSTRTTLSVSANGGPDGGRLALAVKGLERLAPVACGPVALPPSLELAAGETYSAEFLCEAGAESAAANDVEVEGTFVENGTGKTFTSRAALTVVRVEVRATVDPPDTSAGRLNRHRYGVCEEVRLLQFPSSPAVSWTDSTPGGVSCVGSSLYGCPLQGCENPLRASCGGASYAPRLTVVEPESVYAELLHGTSAGSVLRYGAAEGQAGGVGMLLKMYVRPLDVSFVHIEVQEVPSLTYDPHGYFRNPYFNGLFGHTTVAGAGIWREVRAGDHFWSVDEAAYRDTIPWLTADGRPTDSVECAWTDGYVYVDHPFGWRPQNRTRIGNDPDWRRPFAADAQVELMLDGLGTVGVRKLYHQVRRTTNDVVWLDWKKVVE